MSLPDTANAILLSCCLIGGGCYFVDKVIPDTCNWIVKKSKAFLDWLD
jgi:hypothetical protein